MISRDEGQILLKKDHLRSSLPIDLLIEIETRFVQESVMGHILSKEPTLIQGSLTPESEQNNTLAAIGSERRKGAIQMVSGSRPRATIVLTGRTVEELRKGYLENQARGASLFSVSFDRFNPSKSPESRARMGVLMVQTASFIRSAAIASLVPQRFGGAVPERDLPEPVRLEMLRSLAAQGFKWLEMENDIPSDQAMEIIGMAQRSGTKVMLSTRFGPEDRTLDLDPDLLELCSGLKVRIDMANAAMVRSLPSILETATRTIVDRTLMVAPYGKYSSLAWMVFEGWAGHELLIEVRPPNQNNEPNLVQEDLERYWSLVGRTMAGNGGTDAPRMGRIRSTTGLYLLLSGPGATGFKLSMMNDAFLHLKEDKVMFPWETRPDGLKDTLDMIRGAGSNGAIIEAPLRTGALSLMDWVDPRSRTVGSVDLVLCKGKGLYGYNTELYAFSDMIKKAGLKKGMKCLIFGTGSTGRSAAVGSSMMGLDTVIVGSNLERTRALAAALGKEIRGVTPKALKRPGLSFDVVIGTVPMEQLNEPGISEGMDLIGAIKGFGPKLGMDTTVLKGWSPLLSAVETVGGSVQKGSDLISRSAVRSLSIWTDRSFEQTDLVDVLGSRMV